MSHFNRQMTERFINNTIIFVIVFKGPNWQYVSIGSGNGLFFLYNDYTLQPNSMVYK